MANGSTRLPRMMIGFIVRRCAVDLGRSPNAAEFAAWANEQNDGDRPFCLFGRPIDEREAAVILKHRARLVSAKSASPDEVYVEEEILAPAERAANVVDLAAVRARLDLRPRDRKRG
jgi:hypothetical protein